MWSWDASCVHCEGYCSNSRTVTFTVHTACVPALHNHSHHYQCRTPYAAVHTLVLLMMGIMMPETCWDKSLIINVRLVASCWSLSLHPTFMMHGHKSLKHYLHANCNSRSHISDLECFRPREMSSKHPVPTESLAGPSRKKVPRDPRFDSLCGSFNEKVLFIILFWYRSRIWVWRCLTSDDLQKPYFSCCPSAPFISDGSHAVS